MREVSQRFKRRCYNRARFSPRERLLRKEIYSQGICGNFIDFFAPGVNIISTSPGDRYNLFHLTSMAVVSVTEAAVPFSSVPSRAPPHADAKSLRADG